MSFRVGVDIGGSFTDFAVLNEANGDVFAMKVFSRPDMPGREINAGLAQLKTRYGIEPSSISYFTHGTTVGVNTVIQRKGLRLALFATDGFVDVLELARLKSSDMYHLFAGRPEPLITRDRVFPIRERIDAEGTVLAPLDEESVIRAVEAARRASCEGVIVSLLHSYRNDMHERRVKEIVARHAPEMVVFASTEIWPVIREFERTITATISGYVQPRVEKYLSSFQRELKEAGVVPEPLITKSNGGVMTADQGKVECVQMILSGTASGVIGAAFVAKAAGVAKAMSLDIGGTSADIALILDGRPSYGIGEVIGDFQIYIPSISVSSIGEGGGSIAWVDEFGVLKVGPESAGSTPGPACYGKGGTKPTVTDSFAVCGMLSGGALGYDAVKVDIGKAREAILPLADRLGQSVEATAESIRNVCISGMYGGISGLISRFGIDPSEFTLIAFGGAGPMLAPILAREIGIAEVLIPPTPGVLSALGGLVADLKNDFIKTIYCDVTEGFENDVLPPMDELVAKAHAWLAETSTEKRDPDLLFQADMRYRGQSFEIEVPLKREWLANGAVAEVCEAFHARHEELFGYKDGNGQVQLMNLRLVAGYTTPNPGIRRAEEAEAPAKPAGQAEVWLDGARRAVDLYRRADLSPGQTFSGPAIVAQDDCTTVVPSGARARVDALGNLRIRTHAVEDARQ